MQNDFARPEIALVRAGFRTSPRLTSFAVVAIVLTSALPALFAVVTGSLVDALPATVSSGSLTDGPARRVLVLGGLLALVFAIQQSAAPWRSTVIAEDLGRRIATGLANRQTRALLAPATIAHLENLSFLDDAAKATRVGGIGPWAATSGVVQRSVAQLAGLGSLLVVMRYAPLPGLALGVALLVNVRLLRRQYLHLLEVLNGRAGDLRRASYLQDLAHDPLVAKEVRLFAFADWLLAAFDAEWSTAMRQVWAKRTSMATATLCAVLPVFLAVGWVLHSMLDSVGAGALSPGGASALVAGLVGSLSLASVTRTDSWITYGSATIPAQDHLEHRIRTDPSLGMTGHLPATGLPVHEIRFEAVTFCYPGSDQVVLDGLDLVLPSSSSLGLVGVNGAGKTTLVKLLTRLYDPTEGRILVDGIDLRDIDAHEWQRRCAVLFQDFVRYPLSLRDNVALGAPGCSSELLQAAAAQAGILDLAADLPAGWDTILSRQLGGTELSGGQWQRVALARVYAAARAGAGLLVLDEPTSQLDSRAEAAFYEQFLSATRGRAALVISHRLAAIRQADEIVVLQGGRISERGKHVELLERGGVYAELFTLQRSRFGEQTDD